MDDKAAQDARQEQVQANNGLSLSGDSVVVRSNRPAMREAEFTAAVRHALKHYHRPDQLRENPLLGSRLIAAKLETVTAPLTPVQALRDILHSQCEKLSETPKLAALARVLELTYFKPMRGQQAAAEALHLSWSTYRRRLTSTVELLAAQLWEAETALARAAAAPAAVAVERRSDYRPANSPPPVVFRPSKRRFRAAVATLILTAVCAVLWLLLPLDRGPSAASESPARTFDGKPTLAVLPFLNLTHGGKAQYLSDGITDELINRLGRLDGLRVVARTSSFAFRGKPTDIREIGRALGVENVLEGSIQRTAEKLHIRVALVNARNGYERWSSQYDVGSRDLLKAENTIATAVADRLNVKVNDVALAQLSAHFNLKPRAHDFYLVGLEYLSRRTSKAIDRAIAEFRQAIVADPNYAPAWDGLATAYTVLRDYDSDAPPDAYYSDALHAAQRAAALDHGLARPHAILAQLHVYHWEWRQAAREFRLALALDPSDATAHHWYCMYLWIAGDDQGALKQARIAYALDPLLAVVNASLGAALVYVGKMDAAIAQFQATLALAPHFAPSHMYLASTYLTMGRYAHALKEMQAAIELTPTPHPSAYVAYLGVMYAAAGDRAMAERQLAKLKARLRHHVISGPTLAQLYFALGEDDKAYAQLDRAVSEYDHHMFWVVTGSDGPGSLDGPKAADPRYKAILARMHLPI